ncbi:MAG: T6SS phospholipase effector Tle1-like catalytic domain-containing protein, partial [Acidobacteriota bacterium]
MARNLVLCCDGTANEFAHHNTNVVKLYTVLRHDPASQITYYHPGLGTMEPAGALTTIGRKTTKLLGMAIGYGLANDVRDAYVFLMHIIGFHAG